MESSALLPRLLDRLRPGGAPPAASGIAEELWLAIVEGSVEVGERLPTARELAIALGVSPRSVEHAYAELERRGVVTTRPGAGTFVSLEQPSEADRTRHRELERICRETVQAAHQLGFGIDDVLDVLAELRSEALESRNLESGP